MICINQRLFVSHQCNEEQTTYTTICQPAAKLEPVSVTTWGSADMSLFPRLWNWNWLCIAASVSVNINLYSSSSHPLQCPQCLLTSICVILDTTFCPFSLALDQIYFITNLILTKNKVSRRWFQELISILIKSLCSFAYQMCYMKSFRTEKKGWFWEEISSIFTLTCYFNSNTVPRSFKKLLR